MSRTNNTKRNLIWGVMLNIITILLPFLTKTAIIRVMGVEYEGLNGVFTSILQVLSFAELGLGSALVYSMYKPIASGDDQSVKALLNLYKKCYRIIGFVVLAIGVGIVPFLTKIVNRDLPGGINIYYLYCIYLLNNVISYLVFPEKQSLLLACQRDDVNSRITIIIKVLLNLTQIGVIIPLHNYYGYALLIPVFTVSQNLFAAVMAKRLYPQYYCQGMVAREEIQKIKKNVGGMFFQKIGGIVLSSVDAMVISAFLGLKILGIYNGYHYVITALFGFSGVITRAIIPSAGNSVATSSLKKNYADLQKFNFMYQWIIIWWSVCLLCLYQPFIKLWMGEQLLLSDKMVGLFVVYFYIYKWMDMIYVYQEASGIWWQGRWFPLIAAIINLGTNVLLVQVIGLAGVLLSTIICLVLIHDTFGVFVLKKHLFKSEMSLKQFYFRQLLYLFTTVFACGITYWVCGLVSVQNTWLILGIRCVICIILPNSILFLLWFKSSVFRDAKDFVVSKFLKKPRDLREDQT